MLLYFCNYYYYCYYHFCKYYNYCYYHFCKYYNYCYYYFCYHYNYCYCCSYCCEECCNLLLCSPLFKPSSQNATISPGLLYIQLADTLTSVQYVTSVLACHITSVWLPPLYFTAPLFSSLFAVFFSLHIFNSPCRVDQGHRRKSSS